MQLLQSVTATLCSEESSQWQCQFSTDTEPAILAIQFFLVGEFICYNVIMSASPHSFFLDVIASLAIVVACQLPFLDAIASLPSSTSVCNQFEF